MKDIFPEYDNSKNLDFNNVWKNATFVFDANVLLNLYRYHAETRDQLLNIFEALKEQVWIPYHVALEFQRNRLNVIADQSKRFAEVRKIVSGVSAGLRQDLEKLQLDRRHSLIDPNPLMISIDRVVNDFFKKLDKLQDKQLKINEKDPLKEKIERIFHEKVGEEPESQEILDDYYREAEARFKLFLPPGYKDNHKEDIENFFHKGKLYRKKFGDYLIWVQILDYFREKKAEKFLVFVTDDAKEDWWWKVDSDGVKTIGPRPELIDEARRIAGIREFLMYRPELFLKYSKDYLRVDVTEDALQDVREVSESKKQKVEKLKTLDEDSYGAVLNWLHSRFGSVTQYGDFPDFVVKDDKGRHGFEIKSTMYGSNFLRQVYQKVKMGASLIDKGYLETLSYVWIVPDDLSKNFIVNKSTDLKLISYKLRVNLLFGVVGDGDFGEKIYSPFLKIMHNTSLEI
ncbi:PIN domain-containing protein [Roseibium sp. FZY0029]|uniref:PIN domain-containing protein n=1 Tax=Roseibium sp. FZY0029 TaxID=3116647 RepID=UPI002E9A3C76|nr:PIN domain-containing protein [Roseibium sp. FZY0029]